MGVKKYLKNQFKVYKIYLEHEIASDFYLSSLQTSSSVWPLLCIRTAIFLGCLGILLWSAILTGMKIDFKYWPIYLTHWGLVINTVCSGLATVVSVAAYYQGSIDAVFGLPWYVKAYWVSYNCAVPIAIFISIFYWAFLTSTEEEFSIDPVLDVFIHAINSLLMLILVITSRQPTRMLHFYHCIIVTLIYLAFYLIYYYAGGVNPQGDRWIYPNLDWSDPGPTAGMVIGSAFLLITVYVLVVCLSLFRGWFARRYIQDMRKMSLQ